MINESEYEADNNNNNVTTIQVKHFPPTRALAPDYLKRWYKRGGDQFKPLEKKIAFSINVSSVSNLKPL